MSSCDASNSLTRPITSFGARTSLITLLAPHRQVFNFLADIENLPHWAGGFCESLWLGNGRWMALTSLGELFLELEADIPAAEIALLAGWEPDALRRLSLKITSSPEEGTRVKITLAAAADWQQTRLYAAIENELWELGARFEAKFFPVS